MRETTSRALRVLGDQKLPIEARREAAAHLGASADLAAVPALALLVTEVELALAADVRRAALALGATDHLVAELEAPRPEAHVEALRLLGYLSDRGALPALLRELEHPVAKVREQAANALIALRSKDARLPLTRHLFEDADPGVRMAAAQALGALADEAACDALERATASEPDGFARVVVELSHDRARRVRMSE